MKEFCFLDGARLEDAPVLRSLAYGEGVFESFRWKGGPPVHLFLHLERMRRGAEFLGIPPPANTVVKQRITEAATHAGGGDLKMKVCLLSGGSPVYYSRPRTGSLLVSASRRMPPPEAIALWVCSDRRPVQSRLYAHKTLNYLGNIVARREALARGADEALFLDSLGAVVETSCQNVFWMKCPRLFTPSTECPLLPGVTRKLILRVGRKLGFEVECGNFPLEALLSGDCGFLTNASIGMVRVSAIASTAMPPAPEHFARLRDALLNELGW